MKATTIDKAKRHCLSAIESLFSCARIMGMPHGDVINGYHGILANYPELPRYIREYLQGVFDEKWKQLYKDSLIFGGFYNGVFYSVHSDRPDYYGKHGIDPAQWAEKSHSGVIDTGHYYITTQIPKRF